MIITLDNHKEILSLNRSDTHSKKVRWTCDFDSKLLRAGQLSRKDNWKKKKREVIVLFSPIEEKYKKAIKRINELCQNPIDLNAPNEVARLLALNTLELLKNNNVLPSLINSSHDESLVFEFFVNQDTYSIDFCNSGEVIYGRRIKEQMLNISELKEEQLKGVVLEISHAYANL